MVSLRGGELTSYHGAEHVSIGTYESGERATKEHERCGSHLVGPLLLTSAVAGALANRAPASTRRAARLVGAVGALGASIELLGWMTRNPDRPVSRALARPGYELQSRLSTTEPTPEQLEVANAALAACLEAEAELEPVENTPAGRPCQGGRGASAGLRTRGATTVEHSLHVLAAGRGVRRAAAIGTGGGVATAWIASALPPGVPLFIAEADSASVAAAGELFADDPDVTVLEGDWRDVLAPEAPFDFIVRRRACASATPSTTCSGWQPRGQRSCVDAFSEGRRSADSRRQQWLAHAAARRGRRRDRTRRRR